MVESTGIKPYQFESTDILGYSDYNDDSNEPEMIFIREHGALGNNGLV